LPAHSPTSRRATKSTPSNPSAMSPPSSKPAASSTTPARPACSPQSNNYHGAPDGNQGLLRAQPRNFLAHPSTNRTSLSVEINSRNNGSITAEILYFYRMERVTAPAQPCDE